MPRHRPRLCIHFPLPAYMMYCSEQQERSHKPKTAHTHHLQAPEQAPTAADQPESSGTVVDAGPSLQEEPPGGLRVFLKTASSTVKHLLHNPVGTLRSIMEPGTALFDRLVVL